ncbi:hypothetical protein Scep_023721 [Stephania cephalantha]|uniref:Uncharacterized protein n=1 Tax=Stephania cephalantha TaxID=152367 RepID=A0AAP0HXL0_9MAGN
MSMEGLSHLGVQCTTARDRVDDSDEQDDRRRGFKGRRRGIQRLRRQTARASKAATIDGEGFKGSECRWRGLQMQRQQTTRALEAATIDGTTASRHHENSTPNHQSHDDGEKRS